MLPILVCMQFMRIPRRKAEEEEDSMDEDEELDGEWAEGRGLWWSRWW